MALIASRVAKKEEEMNAMGEPLAEIDGAIDVIISAVTVIEKNVPLVKPKSVPQRAAIDSIGEFNDEIKSCVLDMIKGMGLFETGS